MWDTAFLNPSPLGSSVKLPCYKSGSPAGNYLGGDAAFDMNAWGNGRLAGAPACLHAWLLSIGPQRAGPTAMSGGGSLLALL